MNPPNTSANCNGVAEVFHAPAARSAEPPALPFPEIDLEAGMNRILIAEDHEISRLLLERQFTHWGFDVLVARDGQEAMDILDGDNPPPLASLDWQMPKVSGLEICAHVRSAIGRPYIYLILLSGRSEPRDIAASLNAGADDYIVKPFDANELRARLRVGQRIVSLERRLADQLRAVQGGFARDGHARRQFPMCMYCKDVRDTNGKWHALEAILEDDLGIDITHGICSRCMEKYGALSRSPFSSLAGPRF